VILGNIDKQGHLEDNDLLDDESKRHLGALSSLGDMDIGSIFSTEDQSAADTETTDEKSPSAVSNATLYNPLLII